MITGKRGKVIRFEGEISPSAAVDLAVGRGLIPQPESVEWSNQYARLVRVFHPSFAPVSEGGYYPVIEL